MRGLRGKYLLVLVAMCGMIATSLGILTNTAGLFFSPVSEDFGTGVGNVSLTLTICNLAYAASGMTVSARATLLRPALQWLAAV